jgi:diguanylate cyclase (GGDEF)-like protein
MASRTFQHKGKDFNVTVSCGIAEFDQSCIKSPTDLIKIADEALYKAKHEGRNRTIVGSP